MDLKRKLNIGEAPVDILYFVALFIHNMRTFSYGNEVSGWFHVAHTSLEDYVGLL